MARYPMRAPGVTRIVFSTLTLGAMVGNSR